MILAIIGVLALLIAAGELLIRRRRTDSITVDLSGYPPAGDVPCVWPRLEPEVERLRKTGAL